MDEFLGTTGYMAPELARGTAGDLRSDIYAVGVMMFRMLAGRLPFEGGNAFEILAKHIGERPPRPRDLEPSIPAGVDAIILKALAKDPRDRFQSMTELAAALELGDTSEHRGGTVACSKSTVPVKPEATAVLHGSAHALEPATREADGVQPETGDEPEATPGTKAIATRTSPAHGWVEHAGETMDLARELAEEGSVGPSGTMVLTEPRSRPGSMSRITGSTASLVTQCIVSPSLPNRAACRDTASGAASPPRRTTAIVVLVMLSGAVFAGALALGVSVAKHHGSATDTRRHLPQ